MTIRSISNLAMASPPEFASAATAIPPVVAAPILNSGDGPSNHEPGSNRQGRADESVKCSVVTGCRLPTFMEVTSAPSATLDPSQPVSLAGSSVAAFGCSSLSERQHDQASEENAKSHRGDRKVPLGDIVLVAHDAPINLAPLNDADELIKSFGIPASCSACHFGILSYPRVSVAANEASARQPSLGTSLDLPAASLGVAGLSECIGPVDPRIEAMICELEQRGFFVAEMKATTSRVAASSAIHSPVSTTSIPTT